MVEADQLRAEQSEIEQWRLRQRQADMNRLADDFEASVGEIDTFVGLNRGGRWALRLSRNSRASRLFYSGWCVELRHD